MRRYYGSFIVLRRPRRDDPQREFATARSIRSVKDKWGIPVLRFHWKWSEHETRQAAHMQKTFADIIERDGRARARRRSQTDGAKAIAPGGSIIHEVGGAIMGTDAEDLGDQPVVPDLGRARICSSPTARCSPRTRTRIRRSRSWRSPGAPPTTFSSACGARSCDGSAHDDQVGAGGERGLAAARPAVARRRRSRACRRRATARIRTCSRLYQPGELWPLTLDGAAAPARGSALRPHHSGRRALPERLGRRRGRLHRRVDERALPGAASATGRSCSDGFAWLDARGHAALRQGICRARRRRSRTPSAMTSATHRRAEPALREAAHFFARYRDLTAGGFYSTPAGPQGPRLRRQRAARALSTDRRPSCSKKLDLP